MTAAPAGRRLLLLRHATAGDAPGGRDHERALTPAGRSEATAMGLAVSAHSPELVLCSSARRTLQTAICLGLGEAAVPEAGLYLAPAEAVLARLHEVAGRVTSVLVIGHNPGLAKLAVALADDPRLRRGFPPATLAAIAVDARSWSEVRSGRLLGLVSPGQ